MQLFLSTSLWNLLTAEIRDGSGVGHFFIFVWLVICLETGILFVALADLASNSEIYPFAFVSQVPGLKACTTTALALLRCSFHTYGLC